MQYKNILLTLLLGCFMLSAYAQDAKQVQPSIMLLPMVKEGQDIRTIIEESFEIRTGFTKINEAFNQRGFSTVDFRAKLKQMMKMQAAEMTNQQSIRQMLFENSTAEIIVEFDMSIQETGYGSDAAINLNGYDAFSAQILSSEICRSGAWQTKDVSKLVEKATASCIENFLNTMQEKFSDIRENGRPIVISITFDENSMLTMDSEVGEDELPLSDLLELWFDDNAYKGNYRITTVADTKMMLDDVRIPLQDANGRNYSARKFSLKLYLYLKKQGISCNRDTDMTSVYITIE